MDPNKPFSGKKLRTIRLKAGLTQRELAQRIHISRETVIAIENEHPGTINTIELDIVRQWWRICKVSLPKQTQQCFVDYIKQFLKL